jgi:hypothetical protein
VTMTRWRTSNKAGTLWFVCALCKRETDSKESLKRCPRHCEDEWERQQRKAKNNKPLAEVKLLDIGLEHRERDI